MYLSEFNARMQAAGDVDTYALWLAAPDRDGMDVDLAAVGRVDVQYEVGEVRLYPASTNTDTDSVEPEPMVGLMLSQLPKEFSPDDDLHILVELPLLREEAGDTATTFGELHAIHIGVHSREIWLLTRPAADFADGLLPD